MGRASRIYVSICLLGAFTVAARTKVAAQGTPEKTMQASPAATQTPAPVKVSPGLMASLLLHKVTPEYPALAKKAREGGTVVLHAIISKTGAVQDLQILSGPTILRASAVDSVRQWTYQPYLLNGKAVDVDTQIVVTYRLPMGPQ